MRGRVGREREPARRPRRSHGRSHGGDGLSIAFVDWGNLRYQLACSGLAAGPELVLDALVTALREVSALHASPLERVELYLTPAAENRADRLLLSTRQTGVPVRPNVTTNAPGMVAIALTVAVADAWHERQGTALLIVSGDGDVAITAGHYAAKRPGGRPVELLHLGARPPVPPGVEHAAVARRLPLRLGTPLRRRPWTRWDLAAWTLRKLAMPAGDRVAAALLDGWREFWPLTGDPDRAGWERVEQVDDLLAALWRLRNGQPLTPAEALKEAAHRLARQRIALDHERAGGSSGQSRRGGPGGGTGTAGGGRGAGEPRAGPAAEDTVEGVPAAALAALRVAGLLRDSSAGGLEIPSSWREGLLVPARRLVLRLARRRPQTEAVDALRGLHRQRFYSTRDADELRRRLEFRSSADSWDWVAYALRWRLRAVVEETARRPGPGRAYQVWRLVPENAFVAQTVRTARVVRALLAGSVAAGRAEELLRAHGLRQPKRWLRCLRDAGMVTWDGTRGAWQPSEPDTIAR